MAFATAQVVDAVAARVAAQAGLGTGGVKTSRTWPWSEAELPAVRVYAGDEPVQAVTVDLTPINEHRPQILVQYTARDATDLDDTLHALVEAGLPLVFADPIPHGLQLTGITRELANEGEAAVGRITLELEALYHVAPTAPATFL